MYIHTNAGRPQVVYKLNGGLDRGEILIMIFFVRKKKKVELPRASSVGGRSSTRVDEGRKGL